MSDRQRLFVLIVTAFAAIMVDETRSEKEVFGWNKTAGTNAAYVNDPYYHSLEYYSPFWFEIVLEDTSYVLISRDGIYDFADMGDFANVVRATYPDTMKIAPMAQMRSQAEIDFMLFRQWRRTDVIDQIRAVVDTLNFHGINIDFEYPSATMRDSFSVFMAELADSVGGHVSCAVAAVRADPSITQGFEYGVLSDGSHGDLVLQMVYDKFGTWPSNTQSGPTAPLLKKWGQIFDI